jgi:hypothetical protein
MEYLDTRLHRNAEFVSLGFNPNLNMMPTSKSLVISCAQRKLRSIRLRAACKTKMIIWGPEAADIVPVRFATARKLEELIKASLRDRKKLCSPAQGLNE